LLILTRKVGESIVLGDTVKVKVISVEGGQVKLGFDAPNEISIFREEVIEKIKRLNLEAAKAGFSEENIKQFYTFAKKSKGKSS
jgi:carbon storage regulator